MNTKMADTDLLTSSTEVNAKQCLKCSHVFGFNECRYRIDGSPELCEQCAYLKTKHGGKPTKCGCDAGLYGSPACDNYWPARCGILLVLCVTCGHGQECHAPPTPTQGE